MKNTKVSAILYYVASLLFYIAAILAFVNGNDHSGGIVWLGLGATFLCLGAANMKKCKEEQEHKDKED